MPHASNSKAPPMPAEHGAWVVMLVPMLLVWLAFPPRPVPAVLLVLATLSAWLAQSTVPAVRKSRNKRSAWTWLSVELTVFAGSGLALVFGYRYGFLLPLGLLAAGFAALHAWMRTQVRGRRLDRSETGELVGVAGLVLTGPAAYGIARGSLDWGALWVLAICAAFFCSGVLFVQMMLRWLRARKTGSASRWQVARNVLLYHGGLAILLLAVPAVLSTRTALFAIAAFLPTIVRALWGVFALPASGAPSFKTIGVLESVYAVWFAVLMSQVIPIATG